MNKKKLEGLQWLNARFRAAHRNLTSQQLAEELKTLAEVTNAAQGTAAFTAYKMAAWPVAQRLEMLIPRIEDVMAKIDELVGKQQAFREFADFSRRRRAALILITAWLRTKMEEPALPSNKTPLMMMHVKVAFVV